MKSFLHEHPLRPQPRDRKEAFNEFWLKFGGKATGRTHCRACWNLLDGQCYICGECEEEFALHEGCVETRHPREIKHFLHPSCPLTLKICGLDNEFCVFCTSGKGFVYKCEQCWFCICPGCSLQEIPNIEKPRSGEEKILHSSHQHPLTLVDEERDGFSVSGKRCHVCQGPFSGNPGSTTYQCSECQITLHKSCLDMLRQKISHSSHPSCPLIMVAYRKWNFKCSDCQESDMEVPMFSCWKCQFHLCMLCWLMPIVKSLQGETIQRSFLCWPSVTLRDKNSFEEASNCLVCQKPCSGRIYGFIEVEFASQKLFLHESCAEIPIVLDLISHPQHKLQFSKFRFSSPSRCYWCRNDCGYLAFTCSSQSRPSCNLSLCAGCAYIKPSIISSDHKHPLTVLENIYDDELKCQACHVSCKSSPAIRCQQLGCSYTLHLSCGPLPCIVNHSSHVHPLTPKYYYVEDDNHDEDNFCCHVCEERRDPQFPVYYCDQGCPMVAEIKCLLPEILTSLRGERGDVELQIVGKPHISSKVVSLAYLKERDGTPIPSGADTQREELKGAGRRQSLLDIFGSFSEDEKEKIKTITLSLGWEMRETSATSSTTMKSSLCWPVWKHQNGHKFAYSEKAFSEFRSVLDSFHPGSNIPDFVSEHDEFVNVGDVRVARTLVNSFQNLVDTCRDISVESELSSGVKSFVFWILCGTIYSMQATKVVHIDEERLGEWWYWLKWVKHAGFDIQLLMDHMEGLAHAYFGVKARMYIKKTEAEQKQQLEQITKEMEVLERKRETIKEQERDLELSKREAMTSSSLKKCVEKAKAMQWKPAAEGVIR